MFEATTDQINSSRIDIPERKQGKMLQSLALYPWILKSASLPLPCVSLPLSIHCSSSSQSILSSSLDAAVTNDLSAKERRQLRNERREKNAAASGNWRDEVEEILARRRKKEYSNWKEKLNLDNLAKLGTQWWTVRVSRVNGQETVERLSRALVRGFPDMEFKVYFPAVHEKRKLKDGSYSDKVKSIFPGCVFLQCVLNKEVHDYIRDCDGIGGFLGATVGNTKRQINKPKPVMAEDMEMIFQEAKEQQQSFDQAFEREHLEHNSNYHVDSLTPESKNVTNAENESGEDVECLALGAKVRVLSGPFAEFTGRLKCLDHTYKKATVEFTLFGKESFVDLEVTQIVADKA